MSGWVIILNDKAVPLVRLLETRSLTRISRRISQKSFRSNPTNEFARYSANH
jgi:hypothetical protein